MDPPSQDPYRQYHVSSLPQQKVRALSPSLHILHTQPRPAPNEHKKQQQLYFTSIQYYDDQTCMIFSSPTTALTVV
jgi:hypothetical protein